MPGAAAVAATALVGLLSLAATLLPAAAVVAMRASLRAHSGPHGGALAAAAPAMPRPRIDGAAAGWDRLLLWICALLAAALLFFQVRVPLSRGEVNVNPADVIALTALGIALAAAVLNRSFMPALGWLWRDLALLSGLIAAGLVIGLARHGWTDWAFLNRGLGWLVLAGYAVAGASAGSWRGEKGRGTVLLVLAATGVAICLAQVVLLEIDRFLVRVPRDLLAYPLEGFARNRNAFAFQLLMLLVALAVLLRTRVLGWKTHAAACGVTLIVVWETLSRTGWITAAVLLFVLSLAVERIERARFLVRMAAGLALALALYLACSWALAGVSGRDVGGAMLTTVHRHEGLLLRPDADGERWSTIIEGLRLWLAHPLLGSGLGGFVAARAGAGLSFQVIHSVPVWLLAELGLAGFALHLLIAAGWADRARRALHGTRTHQAWGVGLLALLIVMTVAGLVHDFLYQRMFWFLAGLFAAGIAQGEGDQATPDRGTAAG